MNIPLNKGSDLSFKQILQACFVLSLVVIGQVNQEKKIKMLKVYDNNDNNETRDNEQISIRALGKVRKKTAKEKIRCVHGLMKISYIRFI